MDFTEMKTFPLESIRSTSEQVQQQVNVNLFALGNAKK